MLLVRTLWTHCSIVVRVSFPPSSSRHKTCHSDSKLISNIATTALLPFLPSLVSLE